MSKYNKARIKKICDMVRKDTFTVGEICAAVGISESTYHEWKTKKSEFSESLRKAENERKERMIVAANRSLLKLIQGFVFEEVKIVMVDSKKKDSNGNPLPKIKVQTVTTKYVHPDLAAIIFALCNLDPANWKRYQRYDKTKDTVNPFIRFMISVTEKKDTESNKGYSGALDEKELGRLKEIHSKCLRTNLKSEC